MKTALFAVMALALVACGGNAPEGEAAAEPRAAAGTAPVAADESVAAVLQSEGAPVAQLRFVVEGRPEAGRPVTVRLQVSAADALPTLLLSVESSALDVQAATITLALAGGGATTPHPVVVTARETGLAELTVRLRAAPDSPETVYVVPLLVSAPAAA